jgi:hypothetical protein
MWESRHYSRTVWMSNANYTAEFSPDSLPSSLRTPM